METQVWIPCHHSSFMESLHLLNICSTSAYHVHAQNWPRLLGFEIKIWRKFGCLARLKIFGTFSYVLYLRWKLKRMVKHWTFFDRYIFVVQSSNNVIENLSHLMKLNLSYLTNLAVRFVYFVTLLFEKLFLCTVSLSKMDVRTIINFNYFKEASYWALCLFLSFKPGHFIAHFVKALLLPSTMQN